MAISVTSIIGDGHISVRSIADMAIVTAMAIADA